jgi:hypothetical protein
MLGLELGLGSEIGFGLGLSSAHQVSLDIPPNYILHRYSLSLSLILTLTHILTLTLTPTLN